MTSANVITINFAGIDLSQSGDYLGGIFTDAGLASLGAPTIDFLNTGADTVTYEGMVDVPSAGFGIGAVTNGTEMEFQVEAPAVPAAPPWALLLTVAGLLVVATHKFERHTEPKTLMRSGKP
jgi:hypothetical protein